MWSIIENIIAFIGAIFIILLGIGVVYTLVQVIYWNIFDHSDRDSFWKGF